MFNRQITREPCFLYVSWHNLRSVLWSWHSGEKLLRFNFDIDGTSSLLLFLIDIILIGVEKYFCQNQNQPSLWNIRQVNPSVQKSFQSSFNSNMLQIPTISVKINYQAKLESTPIPVSQC